MKKEIRDLIEISRVYGGDKSYILGGGGNTSFKDEKHLYIKASGHALASIEEKGFAVLDRNKLEPMLYRDYSKNSAQREKEVKDDLLRSSVFPERKLRPSVETNLHDMIHYSYVVHTHPYLVNSLMCSNDIHSITKELFGKEAILIPYTDPGFVLSLTVANEIQHYRKINGIDPKIIFLQNHGVFVAADTIEEIEEIYFSIIHKIKSKISKEIEIKEIPLNHDSEIFLKLIDSVLATEKFKECRNNTLIEHFTTNQESIYKINRPFIPDEIVYCKAYPLILNESKWTMLDETSLKKCFEEFELKNKYFPKILLLEKGPMVAIDSSKQSAELALDIFEDAMKISFYSDFFGGPKFMTREQIVFIDNWEVENYRRMVSAGK